MRTKIIAALVMVAAFGLFGWDAGAQSDQAPSPYWMVNGQIYDTTKSSLWKKMDGTIVKILTNGIVVSTFTMEPEYQAVSVTGDDGIHIKPQLITEKVQVGEKEVPGISVIIRNYPDEENPAVGKTITFLAMQTGTSDYNGDRLELWDLGTAPTADDFKKLKADADEQQKAAQNELDEQRRVAAEKAAVAKRAAQEKVLKNNQDLAHKGDAYGLLRMGERYRDGEGVPKDLAKARDYLTKAAAAGSPTAADELKALPNGP